nr:hypothetical protein [Anaerolineae bacterium]
AKDLAALKTPAEELGSIKGKAAARRASGRPYIENPPAPTTRKRPVAATLSKKDKDKKKRPPPGGRRNQRTGAK